MKDEIKEMNGGKMQTEQLTHLETADERYDKDMLEMRKVAVRGDMHKERMRGSGGGTQQKG